VKLPRRQFPALTAGAVVLAGLFNLPPTGEGARSQTASTLKIIVPNPAGGVADVVARLLADQISRTQGPTTLIENRPGAGTVVGTEAASRASPDGNTLMVSANPFLINPLLRKLNYDPLTSFEPICSLARTPTVIVVNAASPYRTLADLLNAARARPGDLTVAGLGPGSATQIAFEMLKREAKIDMTFVSYPGASPAVNALLGGHVTSMFGNYTDAAEQLKAGKLHALATAARTRIETLPEVPTVAESGYSDYAVDIWFGVFAPAKTPKETLSRLAGWFTAALQVPEIKAKLGLQGLFPVGICGTDFGSFLRKQFDDYGRVIREANIKPE
jgi:tripartite-type tricarboxylate transporter receptor subunit TctC